MDAAALLSSYSSVTGLSGLAFDRNGCACVEFGDDAVNLEASEHGDAIVLYTVLGRLPTGSRERLYEELLAANLPGAQACGGALGVDTVREEMTFSTRIEVARFDGTTFASTLDEFAATAAHWRGHFHEREFGPAPLRS